MNAPRQNPGRPAAPPTDEEREHRPDAVQDALPDPEPTVPSLPEPDPGVFHHEPAVAPGRSSASKDKQ